MVLNNLNFLLTVFRDTMEMLILTSLVFIKQKYSNERVCRLKLLVAINNLIDIIQTLNLCSVRTKRVS